jgi:hypothetical protein
MDNQDMSDQQLDPQAQQQEENSLIALRKRRFRLRLPGASCSTVARSW